MCALGAGAGWDNRRTSRPCKPLKPICFAPLVTQKCYAKPITYYPDLSPAGRRTNAIDLFHSPRATQTNNLAPALAHGRHRGPALAILDQTKKLPPVLSPMAEVAEHKPKTHHMKSELQSESAAGAAAFRWQSSGWIDECPQCLPVRDTNLHTKALVSRSVIRHCGSKTISPQVLW